MTPLANAIADAIDAALYSPEGLSRKALKDTSGEWWKICVDYETHPQEHFRIIVKRKDITDGN